MQADEPMVTRDQITALTRGLRKKADLATLAPFYKSKDFKDPNQVKVVIDRDGFALFFSRSPVPYDRDSQRDIPQAAFKHLGLYGIAEHF